MFARPKGLHWTRHKTASRTPHAPKTVREALVKTADVAEHSTLRTRLFVAFEDSLQGVVHESEGNVHAFKCARCGRLRECSGNVGRRECETPTHRVLVFHEVLLGLPQRLTSFLTEFETVRGTKPPRKPNISIWQHERGVADKIRQWQLVVEGCDSSSNTVLGCHTRTQLSGALRHLTVVSFTAHGDEGLSQVVRGEAIHRNRIQTNLHACDGHAPEVLVAEERADQSRHTRTHASECGAGAAVVNDPSNLRKQPIMRTVAKIEDELTVACEAAPRRLQEDTCVGRDGSFLDDVRQLFRVFDDHGAETDENRTLADKVAVAEESCQIG
mmetsp:Transcript_39830/g.105577  ORF Transcript_39830/g.105577 Transcript_39830/m.105577 type:complete len:328 (+) Transcript_39830:421-1404(+)